MPRTRRSTRALLGQGRAAFEAASRLGAQASERERGYIHAVGRLYDDFERKDQRTRILDYERAMRELATRQPPNTEAMIFHATWAEAAVLEPMVLGRPEAKGSIVETLSGPRGYIH